MVNSHTLIHRELVLSSRLAATYNARAVMVGICTLVAAAEVVAAYNYQIAPNQLPRIVLFSLGMLCGFYALVGGALWAADLLSEEKRADTLGLLFITRLTSFDIVVAKMFPQYHAQAGHILAVLPVPALGMMLGGVNPWDIVFVLVACLNLLFLGLSLGMLASALNREAARAAVTALVFVCLPLAPWVVELLAGSGFAKTMGTAGALPAAARIAAPRIETLLLPRAWNVDEFFWCHLALHLMGWIALFGAVWWLPFSLRGFPLRWFGRIKMIPDEPWSEALPPGPRRLPDWFDDTNPLLSAFFHRRSHSMTRAAVFGALGSLAAGVIGHGLSKGQLETGIAFTVGTAALMLIFIKTYLAHKTVRSFVEDRQSGAFELMLSAPISPGEITRGKLLLMKRQAMHPVFVMTAVYFCALGAACLIPARDGGSIPFLSRLVFGALALGLHMMQHLMEFHILVWHGASAGMTAQTFSRASGSTIQITMVLTVFQIASAASTALVLAGPVESTIGGIALLLVLNAVTFAAAMEAQWKGSKVLIDDFREIVSVPKPTG